MEVIMTRKCLIFFFVLLFTFLISQIVEARKIYIPPLQANLLKNKPRLIQLFTNAGINDAESLFSDPRLKLHYDFWAGGERGEYEPIMSPRSIERGKEKIALNWEFLQEVEAKYGVPKNILISLLRVETNLGQQTGKYIVFNSLLTWTVSNTRRWKWAQQELVTFLIICKSLSVDPFDIPGSTHGAFGLTQFIPTSYLVFAVPAKGGEYPDLFNFKDAINCTAYYLQRCGWDAKSEKKMRRSIYAYNWSTSYVNTIFKYAKAIKINAEGAKRIKEDKEAIDLTGKPEILIEDGYMENTELQFRKGG
jgi:membrane-bound lytic murein transglycosylase B